MVDEWKSGDFDVALLGCCRQKKGVDENAHR